MPFTVADVIAGARAWHPAFDVNVHGDTVAFDWLSSFIRIERRKLQSLVPEMILSQVTITLPLAVFSNGAAMPEDVETVFSAFALSETNPVVRGDPLGIVPLEHIQDVADFFGLAYVAQPVNRVYLRGVESDWNGTAGVLINYVPLPTAIAALADVVVLPAPYFDVAIAGLAVFFAMRSGKERIGPAQWQYFVEREKEARISADTALASQRAGEVWRIRELV